MVSRVQHQTATVLKAAKASNLGRAQIKINPHCHCASGMAGHCTSRHCGSGKRPIGLIVEQRKRDIATDTFVYEPKIGREWGSDPAYDRLSVAALGLGSYILFTHLYSIKQPLTKRDGNRIRNILLLGGAGALATGMFHVIPYNLKLL